MSAKTRPDSNLIAIAIFVGLRSLGQFWISSLVKAGSLTFLLFSFLNLVGLLGIILKEKWGPIIIAAITSLSLMGNLVSLFSITHAEPATNLFGIVVDILILTFVFDIYHQLQRKK